MVGNNSSSRDLCCRNQHKISILLGTSCGIQTFLNRTRPLAMMMNDNIKKLLMHEKAIVGAMGNNQKGHYLTYQRFGTSNNFMKVAAQFFREPIVSTIDFEYRMKPSIAYADQGIVLPLQMAPFETIHSATEKFLQDPFDYDFVGNKDLVDASGTRVNKYVELLDIIKAIELMNKYLAGYSQKEKKCKE